MKAVVGGDEGQLVDDERFCGFGEASLTLILRDESCCGCDEGELVDDERFLGFGEASLSLILHDESCCGW